MLLHYTLFQVSNQCLGLRLFLLFLLEYKVGPSMQSHSITYRVGVLKITVQSKQTEMLALVLLITSKMNLC